MVLRLSGIGYKLQGLINCPKEPAVVKNKSGEKCCLFTETLTVVHSYVHFGHGETDFGL